MQLAWVRATDNITTVCLAALRRILFRGLPVSGIEDVVRHIVIFRFGNIGDTLVALPVFDAIRRRYPRARITLLTSPGPSGLPGAADIMPPGRWFDEYISYRLSDTKTWSGRLNLLRRLRKSRVDLFIDCNELLAFHNVVRNLIFAWLSGCRYAAGFRLHHQPHFVRTQMLHLTPYHESQRLYSFVAHELSLGPCLPISLPVSDEDRRSIATLLNRFHISSSQSYAVIHVGAKRQTNRWPKERFVEVADAITLRYQMKVVLTGGPPELEVVNSVAKQMREPPVVLCGQLSLPELAALLKGACLYVGNDTGPMHLAASVGTPTVSIFSARDFPERWHPLGNQHISIRRDAPCSPCFKEVCDRDLICLREIQPNDVLQAVDQQMVRLGHTLEAGRPCTAAD